MNSWQWLRRQKHRIDLVGDLSRDALADEAQKALHGAGGNVI